LKTGEKFEFVVNNWLAVDKGDGQVVQKFTGAKFSSFSHTNN